MIKREILQDLDGDDLTPPPYWIMRGLPPSAPPGLEATLMPSAGPGEVPAAAAAPPPALPEIVEPPFRQALIPAMETSGQCPQNSTSAGPPRLYPPLLVSTDGKRGENTGIRGCALPRNRGKEPHYRCPSESYNSRQFRTHGQGFPRAAAPVGVFSRGTMRISGSLSCGAREVRISPWEKMLRMPSLSR